MDKFWRKWCFNVHRPSVPENQKTKTMWQDYLLMKIFILLAFYCFFENVEGMEPSQWVYLLIFLQKSDNISTYANPFLLENWKIKICLTHFSVTNNLLGWWKQLFRAVEKTFEKHSNLVVRNGVIYSFISRIYGVVKASGQNDDGVLGSWKTAAVIQFLNNTNWFCSDEIANSFCWFLPNLVKEYPIF